MRSAFLLAAMLGLPTACVRDNASHCGNRSGDQTCAELSADTPVCNVCVAANDGCVEGPVSEPQCRYASGDTSGAAATSTGSTEASSGAASGSTAASTSSGDAGDSGTDEGSAGGTGQICGDGVVEGTEQCEPEVDITETCQSEGLGRGELSCLPNCLFGSDGCEVDPECGNDVQEPGEVCDGRDTPDCDDFPSEYVGGEMACTDECTLDTSECVDCKDGLGGLLCDNSGECCEGLVCRAVCVPDDRG